MTSFKEHRFFVNAYQLAAKEWHAGASIKVIALHGWLDNAASFDVLAPLLDDCHIIALDAPGHGYSDHRQQQATYNIWDDLLDVLAVADEMGWEKFHILGHSRGAIMSVLLTAAIPERVKSLVMLDGIFPPPFDIENSPALLGEFLKGYGSLATKRKPHYPSISAAITARRKATQLTEQAARKIVERGLQEDKEGYAWVTDSRLTISSAFKLSDGHVRAMLNGIKSPNLLLVAKDGILSSRDVLERLEQFPHISYEVLEGKHHFHMDEQAEKIAEYIKLFYISLPTT